VASATGDGPRPTGNGTGPGTGSAAGRDVIPRAEPVPAPPPGSGDLLRRGARLGLGAIGLAGRAAGSMFAQVPEAGGEPAPEPGPLALLPGAVVGLAIEVERRTAAVVAELSTRTAGAAERVTRPKLVQQALRPVEDALWRLNEVARREQQANQQQASALVPVIVQQVTENVLAQIDFVRLVDQMPVDDIVGAIDMEGIVARVDLGGVIRESTMSLTMETVDALRSQGIALDDFASRLVDRVLFRGREREVTFGEASAPDDRAEDRS
jgi:hypothetical protein